MQNIAFKDNIKMFRDKFNDCEIIKTSNYLLWENNIKKKLNITIGPLPFLRTYNSTQVYNTEDPINYEYTFYIIKEFCKNRKNLNAYQKILSFKNLLESIIISYGLINKYNRETYILVNCYILLRQLDNMK